MIYTVNKNVMWYIMKELKIVVVASDNISDLVMDFLYIGEVTENNINDLKRILPFATTQLRIDESICFKLDTCLYSDDNLNKMMNEPFSFIMKTIHNISNRRKYNKIFKDTIRCIKDFTYSNIHICSSYLGLIDEFEKDGDGLLFNYWLQHHKLIKMTKDTNKLKKFYHTQLDKYKTKLKDVHYDPKNSGFLFQGEFIYIYAQYQLYVLLTHELDNL